MIELLATFHMIRSEALAAILPSRGGWLTTLITIGAALLAFAAVVRLIVIIWKRYRGQATYYHPRRLFSTLCRAHQLDRQQQRLLLAVSQRYGLPYSAAIFLEPDLFEPERLGPEFGDSLPQLQVLRERLFRSGI